MDEAIRMRKPAPTGGAIGHLANHKITHLANANIAHLAIDTGF